MRLKNLKQIQQLDIIEVFNITVQNLNGYCLWELANEMKAPRILDNREDKLIKDYWRVYSYYTNFSSNSLKI